MSAFAALAVSASDVVVAAPPNGKAGPVALFVIVLLCVAAYFLFRSMSRHLRRVPEEFAPPTTQGAEDTQPAPPVSPGDAS
ncbi:MAG: hypothetical protein JWN61_1662 [Pseudonocardiales bacterium]|nr:hypothetical protein [Pseudonocardiales bacterium]